MESTTFLFRWLWLVNYMLARLLCMLYIYTYMFVLVPLFLSHLPLGFSNCEICRFGPWRWLQQRLGSLVMWLCQGSPNLMVKRLSTQMSPSPGRWFVGLVSFMTSQNRPNSSGTWNSWWGIAVLLLPTSSANQAGFIGEVLQVRHSCFNVGALRDLQEATLRRNLTMFETT